MTKYWLVCSVTHLKFLPGYTAPFWRSEDSKKRVYLQKMWRPVTEIKHVILPADSQVEVKEPEWNKTLPDNLPVHPFLPLLTPVFGWLMDDPVVCVNIIRILQFGLKHHPFTLSHSKLSALMHQKPVKITDWPQEGGLMRLISRG